MKQIFVTGMFRSGTTWLARALNAHPGIAFASDPMRPLFNSFRYEFVTKRNSVQSRYAPLGDYSVRDHDLLERILQADLDVRISEPLPDLLERVKKEALPYSGAWARSLDSNYSVATYKKLVKTFLDEIVRVYGANLLNQQAVGFKEVWTNEFAPALLRTFPEMQVVFVIRDPRAVAASNNVRRGSKYPLFFLGRQWRKLTDLALKVTNEFPDRTTIVYYEALVNDFEIQIRKLLKDSGLEFSSSVSDPTEYIDGDGYQWRQNTNYVVSPTSSEKQTDVDLNKWMGILSDDAVALLELICHVPMILTGYKLQYSTDQLARREPSRFERIPRDDLAQWIRPYSFDHNEVEFLRNVGLEQSKIDIIK